MFFVPFSHLFKGYIYRLTLICRTYEYSHYTSNIYIIQARIQDLWKGGGGRTASAAGAKPYRRSASSLIRGKGGAPYCYIPHKISLRKIKWKDVFIEISLLPTNLCQRTVMHYCIQIWRTTQPSRRQGNFCPYVRVWYWPMRKDSNLYYRHTRNSDTITPVFSCSTLSKNAARVRHLRMRDITFIYFCSARQESSWGTHWADDN